MIVSLANSRRRVVNLHGGAHACSYALIGFVGD